MSRSAATSDRSFSWASAASEQGTAAWVQLNHPGRQSPRLLDRAPVAPSAVPMQGTWGAFAPPRALQPSEIEAIVAAFARAAGRVVRAGFGGVQIHAAHGYLVSQFLSPLTNTRSDGWGGGLEGRMRFLLEVVRATRAEVGPAVPVSVKLNTADFRPGGFDTDEAVEVAAALERERIDLLELSGGTYERSAMFDEARPSTRAREGMFLERAERIRARVSTPLMVTGGFRTREGMEAALDAGVDLIGLARPLAVEPDLAARLLSGQATGAAPVTVSVGVAALDGLITGSWYQVQLERLAAGRPADPNGSRWAAVARYVRDLVSPSGRAAR
ncbi:MAG: NADH:flavin oxidoreductase [Myxococcota bacterium]